MKSLMPHQKELLEHLVREPLPRTVLLRAAVGSGLTEVIVRLVASAARKGGPVVVVTDRSLLVEQWAYRLAEAQAGPLSPLMTSSDVLVELDLRQRAEEASRILVASRQRLSQGPGRRLAEALHPYLLIIDRMGGLHAGPRRELIEELAKRSESVILLTHTAAFPSWFRPDETINWTLRDVLGSLSPVETFPYQPSENEAIVLGHALSLLRRAIGDLALNVPTRPALHASILRLIAVHSDEHSDQGYDGDEIEPSREGESLVQPDWLEEAWAVLDSLEDLDSDGRLEATHTIVQQAAEDHRQCVVTTELVSESDYVGGYLRSHSIPVIQLSLANPQMDQQQTLATLGEESVLVITNAALGSLTELPRRTQVVWWSPPRNAAQAQNWLELAAKAPDSAVTAVVSRPPLPGERDVEAMLGPLAHDALIDSGYAVIVPASFAYGQYLQNSVYACQPGRSFRPSVSHLGFYVAGAIQVHVPLIRYREERVTFSDAEVAVRMAGADTDRLIGKFIQDRLSDGSWENGAIGQVFVLSGPQDHDTVRLAHPIINDTVSASGRHIAWVRNQRYVSLAILTRPDIQVVSDLMPA